MLKDEDVRLILYNIGVVKNVMRDIQKYGIDWLKGEDKETKATDLVRYNGYINSYEQFVIYIHNNIKDFYTLYTYFNNTSAIPLWELLSALEGLDILISDITKSMNKVCSDSEDYVSCSYSTIRQNYLVEDLYSASWFLLSCNRTGMFKLIHELQYKIEILSLSKIIYLDVYIAKVLDKCRLIKDICPNRITQ